MYISVFLSVCVSVFLSVCMFYSFHQSVCFIISICVSFFLSVGVTYSFCLCASVCLPLSVCCRCLPVCLRVSVFISVRDTQNEIDFGWFGRRLWIYEYAVCTAFCWWQDQRERTPICRGKCSPWHHGHSLLPIGMAYGTHILFLVLCSHLENGLVVLRILTAFVLIIDLESVAGISGKNFLYGVATGDWCRYMISIF